MFKEPERKNEQLKNSHFISMTPKDSFRITVISFGNSLGVIGGYIRGLIFTWFLFFKGEFSLWSTLGKPRNFKFFTWIF